MELPSYVIAVAPGLLVPVFRGEDLVNMNPKVICRVGILWPVTFEVHVGAVEERSLGVRCSEQMHGDSDFHVYVTEVPWLRENREAETCAPVGFLRVDFAWSQGMKYIRARQAWGSS